MSLRPVVIIPARMASTRLFGKPLADINGKPMIIRVAERAQAADIGPVVVATDHEEIKRVVENYGFDALMTNSNHFSGSDRIFEALSLIADNQRFDIVINVQGDLPTITTDDIVASLRPLDDVRVDIATLGVKINDDQEKQNPNIVKIVGTPTASNQLRALYFTRAPAPYGESTFYHHIGLYSYRREALERFVSLSPSYLEQCEKLEQLRALENGMRVDAAIIETVPIGVDTAADLETARLYLQRHE